MLSKRRQKLLMWILGAVLLLGAIGLEARAGQIGSAPNAAAGSVQKLWARLARPDMAEAFSAAVFLERRGHQAVELLKARLQPSPPVRPEQVVDWIGQLSSSSYKARTAAHRQLSLLGAAAEDRLREALQADPGTEATVRIRQLLRQVPQRQARTPGEQQMRLAIRVLERIGSAEALEVVSRLADGAPGARTTLWADGARSRMLARIEGRDQTALCGGNPRRDGDMGPKAVRFAESISWRMDLGEFRYPCTGVTVQGGQAFFAADHGDEGPRVCSYLYAVDLATRKVLWRQGRADQVVRSAPAVQADRVYFADIAHGQLVALDRATGRQLWTCPLDLGMQSEPVPAGPTLFIAGDDNAVYAIDAQFGKVIWTHKTPAGVAWQLAADGKRVYVPSAEVLQALDARTGRLLWQRESGFLAGSCAISGGRLYYHSCQSWKGRGSLVALDAASGREIWSIPAEGVSPHAPAVADGKVFYVAGKLEEVWAVGAQAGQVLWRADLEVSLWYSPTVAGDRLYIPGRSNGHLYALNTGTGRSAWTIQTETRRLHGPVSLADGVLYFASRRRDVCAVQDQSEAQPNQGPLARAGADE